MTLDLYLYRDHLGTVVDDSQIRTIAQIHIRTLRFKVKLEAYPWLKMAATEVNQVWNFANATSEKAGRPFSGPPRYLSAFDLDKLTAGSSRCFERIGSDTIQRVNAQYATRRREARKSKLRWRKNFGSNRALGWIPFKAV